MISRPKLLFLFILLRSIQSSQAIWEPPYFSQPTNSSIIVKEISQGITAIEFNEEITPPFVIANINYSEEDIPTITNIQGDGTNSTLGILAQLSTSNQWQLIVTIKQDFESKLNSYSFTVTIGQVSIYVEIAIDNIHDNEPTIQPISKTCHVNENFIGLSSCKFLIQDVDGDVTNLSVTVDAGDTNKGIFSLNTIQADSSYNMTMALNIDKALDYETQDLFSITITVKCSLGSKSLETSDTIIVQVDDLPDEPPKWTKLPSVVTINEKTPAIVQVTAIDGDLGINANISYSIVTVSDNLSTYVDIDNIGQITIQKIDRDATNVGSFVITVKAYESLNESSNINANITVMIVDLDDHVPDIQPTFLNATIPERRPSTLKFDSQIIIKDPDLGESGSFNVKLVSTSSTEWNEAFQVVPSYGYQSLIVTVATTNYSLLDYKKENWRNMILQLRAIEVGNNTHIGIATLQISLLPVNDRYPQFVNLPYEVSVFENSNKGEVVVTVNATDEDFGDIISYKMNSSVLEVNALGVVTIAEDDAFDYERQKVVQEVVQAVDSEGHVTFAQITVNVIDVDDTPPTLTLPSELLTIKENSNEGALITNNITAIDPDTNASLVFRLDWIQASKQGVYINNSLLAGCLEIKSELVTPGKWRGVLTVKENILDYEIFDTLYLNIVVRDVNTQINDAERSAIVTIEIEDENDNSPVFDTPPKLAIEENSNNGKLIGSVVARDADGPSYNKIKYSLENAASTPAGLVIIASESGELTVDKDKGIDCEQIQVLVYTVTATDGELSNNITISIVVIDENDNTPNVLSPSSSSFEVTIEEESPTGTPIYNITAKDLDVSEPYRNITYLINYEDYPNLKNYFYIEPYSGELHVELQGGRTLDRDSGIGIYTIYLILRDNYQQHSLINSNSISWMLTVVLADINDNAPIFPKVSGFLFSVKETECKNGTLLKDSLQATDIDEGDNAKVTYSIVNTTAGSDVKNTTQGNLFRIVTKDDMYAQIYANIDLDGFFGTYTICLMAEDHGSPSKYGVECYQVYIEDVNDNYPVFVYPTNGSTIYIKEVQTVGDKVVDINDKPLPEFFATDKDSGLNAQVNYLLNGTALAQEYFRIPYTDNFTNLLSTQSLDKDNISTIQLVIEARDNGSPPLSSFIYTTLLVITTVEHEPQFSQTTWTTKFTENNTGLSEEVTIPEAIDKNNVNILPADYQAVYYFIVGDASNELFQLNSISRSLRLRQELDREQSSQYILNIVATNNKTGPPASPDTSSQINITVNVEDVNDCAPVFLQDLYAGGIKSTDDIDKVILTLQATDQDLNDSITYSLNGSLAVSDGSLSSHTSDGVRVTSIGQIILNFKPQIDMKGYFYFNVTATDLVGHSNYTHVYVYLISTANMVTFTFLNTLEYVNAQQNKIEEIFTSVFGYKGTVDSVTKAVDDNQLAIVNTTDVQVHFIDTSRELPVEAQEILQQSANIGTIRQLREAFSAASLVLEDLQAQTNAQSEQSSGGNRPWILFIITVAILVCLFVFLLGLYIWKTRSLQERLDKMAASSSVETHNEPTTNVTLSTANLYENKINPVHGLVRPTYVINNEDVDAYIDEALHGLEEKIDLSSTPSKEI